MGFKSFVRLLRQLSVHKTIYLNFKYFPFRIAMKFPIFVSKNMRIRNAGGCIILDNVCCGIVRLGFDLVGIFDNRKSSSIWEVSDGGIALFKGNANLCSGTRISIGGGQLTINKGVTITAQTSIICHDEIELGENCLLSWDILIMDTDLHNIYNHDNIQINRPSKIKIGDNVWIGCRSTILKGSIIPDNSVIAAGSLVTGRHQNGNSIYGGNPLHILKNNIYWKR